MTTSSDDLHPTVEACAARGFCDATFAAYERAQVEITRLRMALAQIADFCPVDGVILAASVRCNEAGRVARDALDAETFASREFRPQGEGK